MPYKLKYLNLNYWHISQNFKNVASVLFFNSTETIMFFPEILIRSNLSLNSFETYQIFTHFKLNRPHATASVSSPLPYCHKLSNTFFIFTKDTHFRSRNILWSRNMTDNFKNQCCKWGRRFVPEDVEEWTH